MPTLVTLEGWIKAYIEAHPFYYDENRVPQERFVEYLGDFAGKLLTAAVADKLLQEALKPEPEEQK